MELLGRTEEIILLTIWRLQDGAFGVSIREELAKQTGQDWSLGSIYAPLHRLERKGLVATRLGEPGAKRGGRRTVLYHLTPTGKQALIEIKSVQDSLWTGIATLTPVRSK
jgi:PadR family transcriptional regulator PadR